MKRVLIVEDDVAAMGRLREVFEKGGFAVEMVINGAEAMVKAALSQPDAVIINEVLNGMRGSEVSSLLRALPSTQKLPIVLYDETHRVDGHEPPHDHAVGRKELFVPSTRPEMIRKAVEKLLSA